MKKYLFLQLAYCVLQFMALNVSAYTQNGSGAGCTATDGNGNVYVAGGFNCASITFGSYTLTNAASGSSDMYIVKYDQNGNVIWAQRAGGTDMDGPGSIATDMNGNVYAIGTFRSSSITFGSFTLINAGTIGDMFIVKYNANGVVQWAQRAGGSVYDDGMDVATDESGNVYAVGNFLSSSITFGSITLNNPGGYMYFVKYKPNGVVQFAQSLGGTNQTGDGMGSLACDGSGHVYLTGNFHSITFGSTTLTSLGANDIFVTKYDTSGTVIWATSGGGSLSDGNRDITTDGSGNVYLTGYFLSPIITFGSIDLTNATSGTSDMFVVKYDPSGNALWANRAGGSGSEGAEGIATYGSSNVFVTGTFGSPTITFGTITLTNAGLNDIFIVRYSASGNVIWAKRSGGSERDNGHGISSDISGNTLAAGDFESSSITFGSITLNNTWGTGGIGKGDMYIVKYDSTGNNVPWAKCAGGSSGGHGKPKSGDAGTDQPVTDVLKIYPNPTNGRVTLSASGLQSPINSISVFNMVGKEILNWPFPAGTSEAEIDLSSEPKGIYIIKIQAAENYFQRKIVLQ